MTARYKGVKNKEKTCFKINNKLLKVIQNIKAISLINHHLVDKSCTTYILHEVFAAHKAIHLCPYVKT